MNVESLLKNIGKEHLEDRYRNNGRLIPRSLWIELKSIRICERCGEKFNEPLYIHHKVAVSNGGSSDDRSNLLAVCWHCHLILDVEQSSDDKRKNRLVQLFNLNKRLCQLETNRKDNLCLHRNIGKINVKIGKLKLEIERLNNKI